MPRYNDGRSYQQREWIEEDVYNPYVPPPQQQQQHYQNERHPEARRIVRAPRRSNRDRHNRYGQDYSYPPPPPPPPPHWGYPQGYHHRQGNRSNRRNDNSQFRKTRRKIEERKGLFRSQEQRIRRQHPYPNDIHLLQNPKPQVVDTFTENDRILQYDTEGAMKPYEYRLKKEVITVNHWGQRKLLLSEIEFLTLYLNPGEQTTVVYAGAGPGNHTNYLAELFPQVHFVLIDPLPKERWVATETDRIDIHYGFMTNDIAKQFSSDPAVREEEVENGTPTFPRAPRDRVLFVSDIRNSKHSDAETLEEHEENIVNDNKLQKDWHDIMKPVASMLKFRCPFYIKDKHTTEESRKYQYLDGQIYLPVWGKVETAECRLLVRREDGEKTYDMKQYEEKMMYFNTETRVQYYTHPLDQLLKEHKVVGMDHCYDCRSEIWILDQYLSKFEKITEAEERQKRLVEVIQKITPMCSKSGRSLEFIEHIELEIGKDIIVPFSQKRARSSSDTESAEPEKKKQRSEGS